MTGQANSGNEAAADHEFAVSRGIDASPERVAFEHGCAPRSTLTITFPAPGDRTRVRRRRRFDTAAECPRVARCAIAANERNLDRLATELPTGT